MAQPAQKLQIKEFWDKGDMEDSTNPWNTWKELFQIAYENARGHDILTLINDVADTDGPHPSIPEEDPVHRRAKHTLYLFLGDEARRRLKEKFNPEIAHLNIHELMDMCDQTFHIQRSRVRARWEFGLAEQQDHEDLRQFHARLQRLASRCVFGNVENDMVRASSYFE